MDDLLYQAESARIEIVAARLRRIGGYRGSYTDAITDAADIVADLDGVPIIDLRDELMRAVRAPQRRISSGPTSRLPAST